MSATVKRQTGATKRSQKKTGKKVQRKTRRWSNRVTRESDALDLENGVFKKKSPHAIALSLKRSAERSKRRKANPFQSSMSMLNFYINRAGRGLSSPEKQPLEKAKDELRKVFHRPPS